MLKKPTPEERAALERLRHATPPTLRGVRRPVRPEDEVVERATLRGLRDALRELKRDGK
jgi:hypothetical protein